MGFLADRYARESETLAAAEDAWWERWGDEYRSARGRLLRLPDGSTEPAVTPRRWGVSGLLARLRARNEAILKERETRRG